MGDQSTNFLSLKSVRSNPQLSNQNHNKVNANTNETIDTDGRKFFEKHYSIHSAIHSTSYLSGSQKKMEELNEKYLKFEYELPLILSPKSEKPPYLNMKNQSEYNQNTLKSMDFKSLNQTISMPQININSPANQTKLSTDA